jgi:transposase InsO family protein
MVRELSVVEQKYLAVVAVLADGRSVTEVAVQWGVSRQSVHAWLRRYEESGMAGLEPRSTRPGSCPHQMPGVVEAQVLELRRAHPGWGPRRILYELGRSDLGGERVPSRSAIYRCLVRAGLIVPQARRRRDEHWKRWERGEPMRTYGVPEEILTDNGKVFTGRFNRPPVEVLFDRVCRENGITHRLTEPRSPTTTGKVERFHRTLRAEFRTDRTFSDLATAQAELDAWVVEYNTRRPHSAIGMIAPIERFSRREEPVRQPATTGDRSHDRSAGDWVARRAGSNGVISVSWQQICLGRAAAGHRVDVHVTDQVLQVWDGNHLLKTVARTSRGEVRKKRASIPTIED